MFSLRLAAPPIYIYILKKKKKKKKKKKQPLIQREIEREDYAATVAGRVKMPCGFVLVFSVCVCFDRALPSFFSVSRKMDQTSCKRLVPVVDRRNDDAHKKYSA